MPPVDGGHRWLASDRAANGVNLTRSNQWATTDHKSLYLGLLLRALTGGLDAPGHSEPLAHPDTGQRASVIRKFKDETAPLIWDGYQRGIESGRILERVLDAQVPGAIVEVGVFRGGLSAYLQGLLLTRQASHTSLRQMWLVDSFQGMPEKDGQTSRNAPATSSFNAGEGQEFWVGNRRSQLAVGEGSVYSMFERFRLLERGNVHALRGFVNQTLPSWPAKRRIALLRVDVDIYAATYDTLHYLYPRLSNGAAVLFDDWKLSYSREAIMDYRRKNKITSPIRFLPGTIDPMAYWFKCKPQRAAHAQGSAQVSLQKVPETCEGSKAAGG